MSFSLNIYVAILDAIAASGRATTTVESYVSSGAGVSEPSNVILRHDVDRLAFRAVAMGKLEARKNVRATYYFRCNRAGEFPSRAIMEIADQGHEVGYHYECLSDEKGNRIAALSVFERNLSKFREIAPCSTVAMHGAPLSRFNNNDLLKGVELGSLGLIADASNHFAGVELAYFTDAGGRWNGDAGLNFRDRVGSSAAYSTNPDSNEFAAWLRSHAGLVYLSTHPERWPVSWPGCMQASTTDLAALLLKRLISRYVRRSA